MNTVDLMATIGRLRRAQPRNPDTQMVCDALEQKLILPVPVQPSEFKRKALVKPVAQTSDIPDDNAKREAMKARMVKARAARKNSQKTAT